METIVADFYDYPAYYDLVYGSDWKAEFDFLQSCFTRHTPLEIHRVFEPACGTGRLLFRLAKAGCDVSGLDLNPKAVAYCNARLRRHKLPGRAWVGDMSSFHLAGKCDAAFNMINSFRHLDSDRAARNHLTCMADCLRRGGLYVLGLHLTPTDVTPTEYESWSARRGNLCVNTQMRCVGRDRRARREQFDISYDVYTPTRRFRLASQLALRTYTARQFAALLRQVGRFEIVETYDFAYDTSRPVPVTAESEDVVYVLRNNS